MNGTKQRTEQEVFEDLRTLAQSPGAIHAISEIIYRDWVQIVDVEHGVVKDDPDQRWSTSKLNTNELFLLLALLVQATDDRTYAIVSDDDSFAKNADALLHELHDCINEAAKSAFDPTSQKFLETPNSLGLFAREAIYYGPASFYLHQFAKFARHRYRDDGTWPLQNVGISVRPIIEIAQFIAQRTTQQMNTLLHMKANGAEFHCGDLTNSLIIPKSDLRKRFGSKVDAFLSKFSTPVSGVDGAFDNPFKINPVALAQLIDLHEYIYVPNQYRLMESVYESPFYWMITDKLYADKAAKNRGLFLEETTAHVMRGIFGDENVFVNAVFPAAKNQKGAEVDVLVRYGEFVLVVQAKSKRVTLKARAGDPDALKADFKGAIQDPFEQALASGRFIESGLRCVDRDGRPIELPRLPRLFPIVLLSDMFPAATILSRSLLARPEGAPAPVIWDIGIFDCVARILPSPIELIFFLKSRGDVFDRVMSDSEYNYLGYHLRAKLALPSEADFMVLERDFATTIDDYMITADLGLEAERPKGILETIDIPLIAELLTELRSAPSVIASVVVDLYEFSGAALAELSKNISQIRAEIRQTRKAIKAFSLPTKTGGLTYAVTWDTSPGSQAAASAIGRKHKYETKSDRWYVILDSIQTAAPIDGLLPLVWPWAEDDEEGKAARKVSEMFRSKQQQFIVGSERDDGDLLAITSSHEEPSPTSAADDTANGR